tara:strand:+ start:117 stop:359 length:243 start_codon:yes stop_codon:yes gene_type:complete
MNQKEIMNMLGIKPEWEKYFLNQIHLKAEKLDQDNELHLLMHELEHTYKEYHLIDFINFHIKQTTPVFGKWNYTKYLESQ